MKVSVIIPTYNGVHKILNALRSIEQQSHMPDEVIVVIDGSTDGTADLLRNTLLALPNFRIIEQQNGGRAQVRNKGAKEAKGELLIFMDDDIIAPNHWISTHIEHHTLIANSLLTGVLESKDDLTGEFSVFEKWLNKKWNYGIMNSSAEVIILKSPYISANNFSIERNLFFSLGQFDDRLNDAEDYDLAVRAFKESYNIYFSLKAWAYHYDAGLKNFKSYIKRLRQYKVAHAKLIFLKPELYGNKDQNVHFPQKNKGMKLQIFKFFANSFWVNAVDKSYLKWLPKSVRCKLYDIVVTSNGMFFPNKVPL